jgi:hypothetical protein
MGTENCYVYYEHHKIAHHQLTYELITCSASHLTWNSSAAGEHLGDLHNKQSIFQRCDK